MVPVFLLADRLCNTPWKNRGRAAESGAFVIKYRWEIIKMDLGLENKSVLIVGASKGIGKGIAMGFAQEHCRIVA